LLAQKFGGMDVWEARKLRELERENTELKKRIADLSLDVRMPKDLNSKQWRGLAGEVTPPNAA
jgi:putative transposase